MSSGSSSPLNKCDSFSSATSGHSKPLRVMDILNLWNDDPEEVLLDLGFGCDEPDLSGRIPARFINHQSHARGINLQVFLEAQKNRLDLENPDVSSRFRQLEVLQQVTTAFSCLVGPFSSPLRSRPDLPPEAQERRRRMGMLFRRASKKSLRQMHNYKTQDLSLPAARSFHYGAPESQQTTARLRDNKVALKRDKSGPVEIPLAEEQEIDPSPDSQPQLASFKAQEGTLNSASMTEGYPPADKSFLQRKTGPGQARESFEMEEIHSFDECSVTGAYTSGPKHLVRSVTRVNSCESGSSGFLEEPFLPSIPQLAAPGPGTSKAVTSFSGGEPESISGERPGFSSTHISPSPLSCSSLSSAADNGHVPSSSSPSSDCSKVLDPSLSPSLLRLLKSELETSNTDTPPNQDQSLPSSLSVVVCQYLPRPSSLDESQNTVYSQSPNLPPTASFTSLSLISSPIPSSLIRRLEKTKSVETNATSSTQYEFGHFEWTSLFLHEDHIPASGCSSSPLPIYPCLFPSATPKFPCASALASSALIESISHSPKKIQSDSFLPDSVEIGLYNLSIYTQKEDPSSLYFQLDKDSPSAPSSLVLDPRKSEERCRTQGFLSRDHSITVFHCPLSSQSHDSDVVMDQAVGKNSDLTEPDLLRQSWQYSNDDSKYLAPASRISDNTYLDSKDTLQGNEKHEGESERHVDTVQAQDVVYISDTERSASLSGGPASVYIDVCGQKERDSQVISVLPAKTKQEEVRKACQIEINVTESESTRTYLMLHDHDPEMHSRAEEKPLETSVDGSDSENEDMNAFFQQLDTEGHIYWAEPIQVSNPALVPEEEELGSFPASPKSSLLPRSPTALNSFSSAGKSTPLPSSSSSITDYDQPSRNAAASSDTSSSFTFVPVPSMSASTGFTPSSCSVAVEVPVFLSSHIVHRKDVPYMTESKHNSLPSILPLDTSTPFRAVQSWTDLQIQRNLLTGKFLNGSIHGVANTVTVSTSGSKMTQKPTVDFSSSPSFPPLSYDGQPHVSFPGAAGNHETDLVSMDTEPWPVKQVEVDMNGTEDEEKIWKTDAMTCCCCLSDECTCGNQKSYNKQHTPENIPDSLDHLEDMMLSLKLFRSVLSMMEEELSEDQALVYSSLSDKDRLKVRELERLRCAVKQEAGELEMQLKEVAHQYDESLKMKMNRLLDEQSLLSSQLKGFLPEVVPT